MKPITHVSLDIETFSTRGDASIASIGAVAFTLDGESGYPRFNPGRSKFYLVVDDPDGHFSPDTIRWHASRRDPIASTGAGHWEVLGLRQALIEFTVWLDALRQQSGGLRVWSHATFDSPIIQYAAARCGLKNPWPFRAARDLRTLYELAGGRPDPGPRLKGERLVHHNALDDAIWQAHEIAMCAQALAQKGVKLP